MPQKATRNLNLKFCPSAQNLWQDCGKSEGIFEINLHAYQYSPSSERHSGIKNYFT